MGKARSLCATAVSLYGRVTVSRCTRRPHGGMLDVFTAIGAAVIAASRQRRLPWSVILSRGEMRTSPALGAKAGDVLLLGSIPDSVFRGEGRGCPALGV